MPMHPIRNVSMFTPGVIQRTKCGPRKAIGTELQMSKAASRRLGEPQRQCTAAPPVL